MFMVLAAVITVVNYYCKMFILQDTVITIINYDCKIFIVQVIVITIVNYNCKMFMVLAAGVDDDNLIFFSFSFAFVFEWLYPRKALKNKRSFEKIFIKMKIFQNLLFFCIHSFFAAEAEAAMAGLINLSCGRHRRRLAAVS